MEIKECYELFDGDYEDVKSRLMKDDLIKRFLIKFLADQSFVNLSEAMEQKNYELAFRSVHTLKGVSKNFSFDHLSASTHAMTETLRKRETGPIDEEKCAAEWEQVKLDYRQVVDAILRLKESETEA